MKTFLIFLILWPYTSLVWGTADYKGESIINDPSVRRRCQDLIDRRNEMVRVKQRLSTLLARNRKLLNITPEKKVKLRNDIEHNYREVDREYAFMKERISNADEDIIRRGCPGLSF